MLADLQGISRKDVRGFAGRDSGADFKTHRVQDVALVAVRVMQESDVGAAVRVVLDGSDLGRHAILVAPEIDHAVLLLVAAAAVPDDDFALVVASAGALFGLEQIFLRRVLGDVALVEHGHKPPRRRIWIKALESHLCLYLLNLPPTRRTVS